MTSIYLASYNIISSCLWLVIALNNIQDIAKILVPDVFGESIYSTRSYIDFPHKLLVATQFMNAIVEISHSVIGITRSSVSMTCLQFFARLSITIGVCYLVPESPGNFNKFAFPGLIIAWSSVELIRYPYYAIKLLNFGSPKWLDWLRYSAFLVLYPLGLLTEPMVIYDSLNYVSGIHYYFFMVGFTLYIPGFYFLYSYMLKQRAKMKKSSK